MAQNESVQSLEFGTAATFFQVSNDYSDPVNVQACRELGRALQESKVHQFTMRRFHIDGEGLPFLVQGLKSVKEVELHQIVSDINLFDSLAGLCQTLKKLSFVECGSVNNQVVDIHRVPDAPLSKMLRVQELRIAQCEAKEFMPFLCALSTASELALLDLRDTKMDRRAVERLNEWLGHQSNLQEISLEGCCLDDADLSLVLKAVLRHERLLRVNFGRNEIKGMAMTTACLPRNLQAVDLSENKDLGKSGWLPLLVENNPSVQDWKLSSINMNDQGLTDLCKAFEYLQKDQPVRRIRTLELQQTSIEMPGMTALSKLLTSPIMMGLRELNLASCALGDETITMLAQALTNHKSLVKLTVAFNPFGNDACRALAEMAKHMTSLQTLEIPFGKFDQNGLKHFVSTLQVNSRLADFNYWTYTSFGASETDQVEKDLLFWLGLNHAGRRVVEESSAVPPQVYPVVLERAHRLGSTDALHYILRESVHLFEMS